MAHYVICPYCKKKFNRDKEPCVPVLKTRYAHQACFDQRTEEERQLEKDKQELDDYIINLFHIDYVDPKIQRQINSYIEDYHFTYSGILKALIYHFEIKHQPIEKANNGIGIVPYIYKEAYQYYYSLWMAQQLNQNKDIKQYIPQVQIITIRPPERKVKKRKLFTFLDEEE